MHLFLRIFLLLPATGWLTAFPAHAEEKLPTELRCLAQAIYWEARSLPEDAQIAVANVVLNRKVNLRFPDTLCGVVRQGGERPLHRCQFSWWCDGKSDTPGNLVAWRRAINLARQVVTSEDQDITSGALFFHHVAVSPRWARVKPRLAKFGSHMFYR